MKKSLILFSLITLLTFPSAIIHAQFEEDLLRPNGPASLMSSRAAAMGNAFIGVSDDISALHFNPAGLAQMRQSEFSLGFVHLSTGSDTRYLSFPVLNSTNSKTGLGNVGLSVPFPVVQGSFVVGASYFRLADFSGFSEFKGFNNRNSIQPTLYQEFIDDDLAWNLGLEDTTQLIPITDNVGQTGSILESGGLNSWSFGGSAEVAPKLMLGLAFNIITGSYEWERTITETDPNGVHGGTIGGIDFDRSGFQQVRIDDNLTQDISGWNMVFGVLYNFKDKARFGLTVKTPVLVTIQEDFQRRGQSMFAQPANTVESYKTLPITNEYDVNSSWVFGVGASFTPVDFITVAADAEFVDNTQFTISDHSDEYYDAGNLNRQLKKALQATTNIRAGAEIRIPETSLFLRGGFGLAPTAYTLRGVTTDFDVKTFSGGLGYLFDEGFMLNATFFMTKYTTFRDIYAEGSAGPDPESLDPDPRTMYFDVDRTGLMFSFSYKF